MKKLILLIVFLLTISNSTKAQAQEKQAGSSAALLAREVNMSPKTLDYRVVAIENVFKKYNSPLVPYAHLYVKYADKYDLDWKLLPSISGLESYFGKYLMPDSYNAYGWGGGYIYFKSWEEGIDTINKALRKNYVNKGADTVSKIGPIYAESKTWSQRVSFFMDEINLEYVKLVSASIPNSL